MGGGLNHRFNLSDEILIKDNHISVDGNIEKLVKRAVKNKKGKKITVEVDNLNQIREALITGVDGFLLDNMSPDLIKDAVKIIRNSKGGDNIFLEASGGVAPP